jgi:CBS domain-containing protein
MHAIRHVIRPHRLVTAPPSASVLEVARTMRDSRVGAIPIVEGGRLVGIFSERDLMTRIVVEGRDPQRALVAEVMTHEVLTATPDDTRSECLERMRRARCRHLPVLEDGRLVAVLSMRDLLRDEIEEQDEEIRGLRAYLHQTPT